MVRMKNFQGASNFYIQLDMSGWSEIGTFSYTLQVSLVDYPDIAPMEQEFDVLVTPLNVSVPAIEIAAVEDQGYE